MRSLDEQPANGHPPRLLIPGWQETHGVLAGITTRGNGFDLGLFGAAPTSEVIGRWREVFAAFQPAFRAFHLGWQIHGTGLAAHERTPPGWIIQDGVDGHLTDSAGTLLLVTVADCVPVYLVHPPSGAVGLLHAGWRGTAAGILEEGVRLMARRYGADSADVVIHCGVAICGKCYEVNAEVAERLTGRPASGPRRVDLRELLAARAHQLGVGEVTVSGWCTAHHCDRFFSHRASGGRDGRMVAFVGAPGHPGSVP